MLELKDIPATLLHFDCAHYLAAPVPDSVKKMRLLRTQWPDLINLRAAKWRHPNRSGCEESATDFTQRGCSGGGPCTP